MSTTIKSSALDFNAIKNNLKVYFEQQTDFADYDFEGSGLSNILDVLAYNTHLNALTANFALNEAFMATAQLRGSVVSLSEAIGYIPSSATSSRAVVRLSLNLANVAQRPAQIFLPAGQLMEANVDGVSYTFQTSDALESVDDGQGIYSFTSSIDGNSDINVFEGHLRTKTFLVGGQDDDTVYVIPDINMDTNSATVKVYATASSSTNEVFDTYTDFKSATTIDDSTRFYVLRESPNENFDLSFGNGSTLGLRPVAGNKVEVQYLSTGGTVANGAAVFTPTSDVDVIGTAGVGIGSFPIDVVTVNKSYAGSSKETIESIRYNAPYVYASQNRMVTARDYAAVILERFPNLIKDIVAWGGEDNIKPKFGSIFVSILYEDGILPEEQEITKNRIVTLSDQISVMSFDLEFADAIVTYIEAGVRFDFRGSLTPLPLNTIQSQVRNALTSHFDDNTGSFGQSFRKSSMLTDVDEVSLSVLSSQAEIKMQQRVTPILGDMNNFNLEFPAAISVPDDVFYVITSTQFTYRSKPCSIKNQLNKTTLQIIDNITGDVINDAMGSYNPTTGKLSIVGFAPEAIVGGVSYIKISAVPANSNTITPLNNNVLVYDNDASFVLGTSSQ
jgi:hypothetical protein